MVLYLIDLIFSIVFINMLLPFSFILLLPSQYYTFDSGSATILMIVFILLIAKVLALIAFCARKYGATIVLLSFETGIAFLLAQTLKPLLAALTVSVPDFPLDARQLASLHAVVSWLIVVHMVLWGFYFIFSRKAKAYFSGSGSELATDYRGAYGDVPQFGAGSPNPYSPAPGGPATANPYGAPPPSGSPAGPASAGPYGAPPSFGQTGGETPPSPGTPRG